MPETPPPQELEAHDPTYYVGRLQTIIETLDIAPELISERALRLSAETLSTVYQQHGDVRSETYKAYHNDEHGLDGIRRGLQLWRLWQSVIPEAVDDKGYELVMLAMAGHDYYMDPEAPAGENERRSGRHMYEQMLLYGYEEDDAQRVNEGIVATTVAVDEQGNVIQSKLLSGSKDLLNLACATADINGAAMEGAKALVSNSIDLFLERSGMSIKELMRTPLRIAGFFCTQPDFLRTRLISRDQDLDYFLTEAQKRRVLQMYDQEFTPSARDALHAARSLLRSPEVLLRTAVTKTDVTTLQQNERLARVKSHLTDLLRRE